MSQQNLSMSRLNYLSIKFIFFSSKSSESSFYRLEIRIGRLSKRVDQDLCCLSPYSKKKYHSESRTRSFSRRAVSLCQHHSSCFIRNKGTFSIAFYNELSSLRQESRMKHQLDRLDWEREWRIEKRRGMRGARGDRWGIPTADARMS